MSRLATKVVVAAILAFTAVTASGCLATASVEPPLGVAAG
ncbi:putative membrane protein [Mycobacterium intracellulare MIN_052511_1280]|nr:putative membrane protein [Mycobacterium intracellulare MIN_052511_1280]